MGPLRGGLASRVNLGDRRVIWLCLRRIAPTMEWQLGDGPPRSRNPRRLPFQHLAYSRFPHRTWATQIVADPRPLHGMARMGVSRYF